MSKIDIKVEKRGKYAGIKIHLGAEECKRLLAFEVPEMILLGSTDTLTPVLKDLDRIIAQLVVLMKEEPDLLEERTPEEIAAILVKETEKSKLQLAKLQGGEEWKKIKPEELEVQLLKHLK